MIKTLNLKFITLVCVAFVFFLTPLQGEMQPLVEAISQVIKHKDQKQKDKTLSIIAIGGCPGVGKSTFAKTLQSELKQLGFTSVIIGLDHYGLSQKERKQFKSELDPRRIAWDKLHDTLRSIQKGDTEIVKPVINQLTKEMGEERLDLRHVDCVLFEGAYSLADFPPMDFLQYIDFGIYLETALENIYDWKWQRELKKASPRSAEAFFHHMEEIVRDFAFHVYPTKKNADCVLEIDCEHHYKALVGITFMKRAEPDFTALRLDTFSAL